MSFGGRHHQKWPPEPSPPSSIFYFLLPAVAAPGFGLAGVLDSVPAAFFLSDLGFLGSRLLLFRPFAIAVLHAATIAQPATIGCSIASRQSEPFTSPAPRRQQASSHRTGAHCAKIQAAAGWDRWSERALGAGRGSMPASPLAPHKQDIDASSRCLFRSFWSAREYLDQIAERDEGQRAGPGAAAYHIPPPAHHGRRQAMARRRQASERGPCGGRRVVRVMLAERAAQRE
jgi:hypothetical protein